MAVIEEYERAIPRAGSKFFLRGIDSFIRQLEYSVRPARPPGAHGPRRHAPARLVSPDRQQREPRRTEFLPDLGKMTPERSIPREVDALILTFDDIPAPRGCVEVQHG